MQLISYGFLAFLILGAVLYYTAFKKCQWIFLLVLSVCFYLAAGWKLIAFPLVTAAAAWAAALRIGRQSEKLSMLKKDKSYPADEKKSLTDSIKAGRKRGFILCLVICFGILGVMKYTDFVLALAAKVINAFGIPGSFDRLGLVLPLGISYYTFQAMGYLIDVYRKKYEPERSFLKVLLFILFFPQLTSGPISRFDQIGKQLSEAHTFHSDDLVDGLERILWGMFKKLVIAERMSGPVMAVVNAPEQYEGIFVLIGMVSFTLWMYADFSGGIDIVLGAAKLFGITLPENFNMPFTAASLGEFWTKWHMTLMQWMKDYVFYPAATSGLIRNIVRKTGKILPKDFRRRLSAYLASMIVWFITGIWHGASERFVVWGMANFLVMTISQELVPFYRKAHKVCPWMSSRPWRVFMAVRTFMIFSVLEMFECYPIRVVFSRLWSMVTQPVFSRLTLIELEGLGLIPAELVLLIVSWGIVIAAAGIKLYSDVSGRDLSLKQKPALRLAGVYGLFLFVLVMGRYGHGYAIADFFYNSF